MLNYFILLAILSLEQVFTFRCMYVGYNDMLSFFGYNFVIHLIYGHILDFIC